MPTPAATWTDKKAQIYDAINRLEALEAELAKVKQILADVAKTDPGGGGNIVNG